MKWLVPIGLAAVVSIAAYLLPHEATAVVKLKRLEVHHPDALRTAPPTASDALPVAERVASQRRTNDSLRWRITTAGPDKLHVVAKDRNRAVAAQQANELAKFIADYSDKHQMNGDFLPSFYLKEALAKAKDPEKIRELQRKLDQYDRAFDLQLRSVILFELDERAVVPKLWEVSWW